MEEEKWLCERVNDIVALERVIDVFHERVAKDPLLERYFRGVDVEKLKAHQASFLMHALGGGHGYSGREMREAHAHLRIGAPEFDAMTDHLMNSLSGFGVGTTKWLKSWISWLH